MQYVSKYIIEGSSITAFKIPRDVIEYNYKPCDEEYNRPCIYLLCGSDENGITKCYVGQSNIRSDGGNVITRIKEHSEIRSVLENSFAVWDYAVVISDSNIKPNMLNNLEYLFFEEVPEDARLNIKTPSSHNARIDKACIGIVDKAKPLLKKLCGDLFAHYPDSLDEPMLEYKRPISKLISDQGTTEITTPHRIVRTMLNMFPSDIWNEHTIFLDPVCKKGEFLKEIYNRLMNSQRLKDIYPNEGMRGYHILKNQIYGLAVSEWGLKETRKSLYMCDEEEGNIRLIPDYINVIKRIFNSRRSSNETNSEVKILIEEVFHSKDMKIDVVIGNPPYNDTDTKKSVALYSNFFIMASGIGKYVEFITPARWYCGGRGLGVLRQKLLGEKHLRILFDHKNYTDVFKSGVSIRGGICYYLYDKSYTGNCRVIEKDSDEVISDTYRDLSRYDVFIRDFIGYNVIEKILRGRNGEKSLSYIVRSVDYFRVKDNPDVTDSRQKATDIKIVDSSGELFADRGCISDEYNVLDCYNVIVTHAVGSDKYVIPKTMRILEKGEACSVTYLCIGAFDDKKSAENLKYYIKTKFVRFLMKQTISGISLSMSNFMFVPMQDFTINSDIDWDKTVSDIDKQLYKKYGLTQDEISYIENEIEYME